MWDGSQRIELPPARNYEAEETVWNGPQAWTNPYTGETLQVYDRQRTTRREGHVEQKMALRADQAAIGRVYDSRFGASVCDQEAKFPLGFWKQGEVRTYDYVCLRTVDGRVLSLHRRARITIEEWLKRMPNVRHDPQKPVTWRVALIFALRTVPILWDPMSVRAAA